MEIDYIRIYQPHVMEFDGPNIGNFCTSNYNIATTPNVYVEDGVIMGLDQFENNRAYYQGLNLTIDTEDDANDMYSLTSSSHYIFQASQSITIESNFDSNDKQLVMEIDADYCSSGKKSTPFAVNKTRQEDVGAELKVYPNPTSDLFTLDLGFEPDDVVQLRVFNAQLKQIIDLSTSQRVQTISLENHPKGIYLIEVSSLRGGQLTKIVKQ